MTRDPRYDILFEPIEIGPLTAKNRFFQVPHCNGMGSSFPTSMAAMRGMKAEGGWAVVCTEETEIHPTSDISPYIEGRLWNDDDIPVYTRMNELVHIHGALAGILSLASKSKKALNLSAEDLLQVKLVAGAGFEPATFRL